MNNTIKLSELLEAGFEELSQVAYEMRKRGASELCDEERYHRALRAIAPALVNIAKAAEEFNELHGSIESTHIPEQCPACSLVIALSEAGVTCD